MTDVELNELRAQLAVWKAEVCTLGERLGSKTAEADLSKNMLERVLVSVEQLKSEAVSNRAHITFFHGEARKHDMKIDQLEDEAERKNIRIRELTDDIRGYQGQVAQLKEIDAALKEENARLDHASVRYFMDQQTTKVNEAMAETARALSRLSTADGKVAKLAHDLAACREQGHVLRAELRRTREEKDKLGEEWSKLLEQKQAFGKDNDKLRRQWRISEGCLDSSLTRERGNQEQITTLDRELKRTQSKLRASGQEVMRLRELTPSVYTVLKIDLKTTQDRLAEAGKRIASLESLNDYWTNKVNDTRHNEEAAQMRLSDVRVENARLTGDLSTTRSKVLVLKRRLGRLTSGETLFALGITDLEHKEQITQLEEEFCNRKAEIVSLENHLIAAREVTNIRSARIDSLRGHLRKWKEASRKVKDAFNALHLESGATTDHPPLRPTYQDLSLSGWTCVRCGKQFISKREAHDMDKHEQDCVWVELSEVRAGTQQDVFQAFK